MAKSIEIENIEKLINVLQKGGAGARQALRQSLYVEAQIAFAESQEEVPVDKSHLRNSGQAYGIQVNSLGDTLEITLGYGGVAASYALIVHEDMNARHKGGTKAKYLEDPIKRRSAGLAGRLLSSVDNALRRLT